MSNVVYSGKSAVSAHLYGSHLGSATNKVLKYQSIAPAPPSADGKTRKYTARAPSEPYNVDQTQSVQRRNARERNRVKQVNNSFARLRQHIPQSIILDLTKGGGRGPHKKISKVDTLRIAVEYIRRLQDLVEDLNGVGSFGLAASNETVSNSSWQHNSPGTVSVPSPASQTAPPYYTQTTTPDDFHPHKQQQQQSFSTSSLLTPTSMGSYSPPLAKLDNAGCHSPTSSFNSSSSFDSGTFEPPAQPLSPTHTHIANQNGSHLDAQLQLKFEPYENFNLRDEDCTPDEEEILDYISLWQEQQ